MSQITPHVFISAASDDLRSARQVVKNALLSVGCYPIVQEHFEPDYRTVADMIRERIEECHAVIHLIGYRYGGEPSPESLPEGEGRRSWTQMEFFLAREMGVKTYLFLCDETYPFDTRESPEPNDEVELQRVYREMISTGEQLYTIVKSPEELARRVGEMRLEAAELRKEVERSRNQLSDALESMERHAETLQGGQRRIMAGLDDLSASVTDLAELGGIVADPESPQQFYHNARVYEMRGDYRSARRSYLDYFKFDIQLIDPHLRFQQFLKIQEGLEGARETYQWLAGQSRGTIVKLALALLWERQLRVNKMRDFLKSFPDFGPGYYLLSQDYSAARVGSQTLLDKRNERENLERFEELDGQGKVVRWFLDKSDVAEWRSDAETRLSVLGATRFAIDQPVTIYWTGHNTGWTGTIQISEISQEIFWRQRGEPEFVSTGFSDMRSYSTGKPHPQPNISLSRDALRGTLEVRYLNDRGESMGPFMIPYDFVEESISDARQILDMTSTGWVSFRLFDGKLLLYFTHLLVYRGSLESIEYGLDVEEPDRDFPFQPFDEPGSAPIDSDAVIYLEVPVETSYATVRVNYKDGSRSAVVRFNR